MQTKVSKLSKLERYRALELIPAEAYPASAAPPHWIQSLRSVVRGLLALSRSPEEPRIYRSIDDAGVLCWDVTDRRTGASARLYDESEVRAWIEAQLYERRPQAYSIGTSAIHRMQHPLGY